MAVLAALCAAAPAARAALSVPSTTFTSLPAFEAAVGGADNGTTAGKQSNGFRHVTWTGVAADGSDPGSTVITPGHVAALSRNRLQPWGLELGPDVAVANDSFASVNSHASGLFAARLAWAPFNSNTADLDVIAPAGQTSTAAPAMTRGLGVVFLNVTSAATTTIRYFNGQTLLGQVSAPTGAMSFAGMLFRDPVVNRVAITLGSAMIFSFDGRTVTAGGTDPNTLAAGDDVVLAEPGAGQSTVAATAGVPVSSALGSFSDTDTSATPADFRASIDWGDGVRSLGTIAAAPGGGFVVTGSHAYAEAGSFSARVTVDDFSASELALDAGVQVALRPSVTSLICSPPAVAVSAGTTCTATVSDTAGVGASGPGGLVSFTSGTPGAAFGQDGGCQLAPTAITGVSSCAVQFTPGQRPPKQAHVAALYAGDEAHGASNAAATVSVRPQRCALKVLTRRLRRQGLGVLVTCDARSGVSIGARAVVAHKGGFRGFQLQFGAIRASVTAARPTVLLVKPAAGVLPALRAALHRHQHVSLKLTLTASSHATSRTTTTRVSALRP